MKKTTTDKTIASYNRVARGFDATKYKRVSWVKTLKKFAKFLPGHKIIDIGCGSGVETEIMRTLGFRCLGVDASAGMIRIAKEKFPQGNYRVMSFYELKFPKQSFDGFLAIASLLHIPKKRLPKVLKSINQILKPGAVGFIVVKQIQNVGELNIKEQRYGDLIERFFAFYAQKEFATYLSAAGFRVVKQLKAIKHDKDRTIWLNYYVKKGK